MSLLKFLKSATVTEVQKPLRTGGGVKKERIPSGLSIRVFKDGSTYPSDEAVAKFNLEYVKGIPSKEEVKDKVMDAAKEAGAEVDAPKTKTVFDIQGDPGNGFDVIDSRVWPQYKGEGQMIFISPVSRDKAKIDLFGVVRRDDETGEPTSYVQEQGSATYGKAVLLPALKEVYGVELGEDKDYIDLNIIEELEGFNISTAFSVKLSHFPKTVARGDEKGKPDYIRRENAIVYLLAPAEATAAEEKNAAVTQAPSKKNAEAVIV